MPDTLAGTEHLPVYQVGKGCPQRAYIPMEEAENKDINKCFVPGVACGECVLGTPAKLRRWMECGGDGTRAAVLNRMVRGRGTRQPRG